MPVAERAARYDAIADWYDGWAADEVADPVTASALALAGDVAGARVLDLACGSGRVTRALARRGAEAVGVDLSRALIEKARRFEGPACSYLVGDACATAWWDGRPFQGVVSNMALGDVEDLDAATGAIAAVLEPGGWLVFSIFHPCFPGSEAMRPSWPPDGGYFDERWWRTDGDGVRGRVGNHHRTLSTYLNAVLAAELTIERVAEPQPAAAGRISPLLPTWLVVRCRRG